MNAVALAPNLIRRVPGLALKRLLWSFVRRREFNYHTTTMSGYHITGNTRDWIQRNLYYFGLWEPNLSSWIESRLSPGDAFIDVGANIGYFTLLASRQVGASGKVVAIEPMPAIFEHLAAHVAANGLPNTRLVNEAAVGPGGPREVMLFWGDKNNMGSTGMIRRNEGTQSVTVPARALADILTDDECGRARVVKVDVEGVEADTVRGIGLESGRFSDQVELVVEVSYEPERLVARDWLMQYLKDLGFFAYVLPENHNFCRYAYPKREVLRPLRLKQPLTRMQNVIFSRVDADSL